MHLWKENQLPNFPQFETVVGKNATWQMKVTGYVYEYVLHLISGKTGVISFWVLTAGRAQKVNVVRGRSSVFQTYIRYLIKQVTLSELASKKCPNINNYKYK